MLEGILDNSKQPFYTVLARANSHITAALLGVREICRGGVAHVLHVTAFEFFTDFGVQQESSRAAAPVRAAFPKCQTRIVDINKSEILNVANVPNDTLIIGQLLTPRFNFGSYINGCSFST